MSHQSEVSSDQQWDTVGPLLPELMSRGRPWRSNREVFEEILWALGSGAGWPDLAAKKGACHRKNQRRRGYAKLMLVADGQGIPVGGYFCSVSPAEVTLVEARLA
ncbi:hypothetical protein CMK12_09595 [Candidatus Poribacteria bacterium]|jgi:transposase|nr:hypothetical protein [Candidatus Poribacteria bacterium]MDP6596214.1 transposase [Candidatus Poribacteria bacterium]